MEIKRNPSIEQWLFDEIRNNWGKEARKGIHLSDLLAPRKAYWQRIKPMYPTDLEIQYWLTGMGHENALSHASGYLHAEEREWNGIRYTPDFFHNFPAELKTRRRNLAKDGEEEEVYEHYWKQLKGYCAVENKTHGWLHVWCLAQQQEDGTTKPEVRTLEVDFTEEELDEERFRLVLTRDNLEKAIMDKDHKLLGLCPTWMCGKTSNKMITPPKCLTCDKEFDAESRLKRHLASKKGKDHQVQPGTYEKEYLKACKWWDDCLPFELK